MSQVVTDDSNVVSDAVSLSMPHAWPSIDEVIGAAPECGTSRRPAGIERACHMSHGSHHSHSSHFSSRGF